MVEEKLAALIDAARKHRMTDAEAEEQRRSFAHGNAHIENPRITRQLIDEAAERMTRVAKEA